MWVLFRRRNVTAVVVLVGLGVLALAIVRIERYYREGRSIHHNNLGVALFYEGFEEPRYFRESVREFEASLEGSPVSQPIARPHD